MHIKTVLKIIAAIVIIAPAIGAAVYYGSNQVNIPFETVCEDGHDKYTDLCDNVGKRAHPTKRMQALSDTDYGQIVGVAWRKRGSSINSPGQEVRYSESNSYYYIIAADKKGYYFLTITNEIDPK